MYEATTSEENTSTFSQDLYATESRFRSSTSPTIMNVIVIVEFFALHLLLCKLVTKED